ncbi:MAG: response regulator [Nitrospinales bacterium]
MHKVLVVDDEKKILVLTKKFLGKENYRVITSADPIEALEIMESERPISVVLTDERMPHMKGTEFLEKVKVDSPCTSRILTTGQFDGELMEKAVNDGKIFRFLKKPLDVKAVKRAIREAIAQYEKQLRSSKRTKKVWSGPPERKERQGKPI